APRDRERRGLGPLLERPDHPRVRAGDLARRAGAHTVGESARVLPLDEPGKEFAQLLSEKFELIGFLGKGGFASVYKAKNRTLGRFEAVKVLNEARAGEPDFAERFRKEARVAASLEHPSIV